MGRTDAVAAEEDRQLAQARRVAPGGRDPLGDQARQAADFMQPLGGAIEDGRERLTKVGGNPPGEGRADSLDL